jgi:ATP adenylyltransferase
VSDSRASHGQELLWAPWRIGYIRSAKSSDCPFCLRDDTAHDEERLVLARGEHAAVVMNLYPYNNGHMLIAPYEHTGDFTSLPPETLAEMGELIRVTVRVLGAYCYPEGFNVGYNLGRAAGAGVEEHLHAHVIPRWGGDTSFLSTVAGTKVIVQCLFETYRELRPRFDQAMAQWREERVGLHGAR